VAAPRSAGALWSSSMHRDEQGPDGSVGRSRATTGPGRLSWRQIYGVFFFAPLAPPPRQIRPLSHRQAPHPLPTPPRNLFSSRALRGGLLGLGPFANIAGR
jgi:hypothetical protein